MVLASRPRQSVLLTLRREEFPSRRSVTSTVSRRFCQSILRGQPCPRIAGQVACHGKAQRQQAQRHPQRGPPRQVPRQRPAAELQPHLRGRQIRVQRQPADPQGVVVQGGEDLSVQQGMRGPGGPAARAVPARGDVKRTQRQMAIGGGRSTTARPVRPPVPGRRWSGPSGPPGLTAARSTAWPSAAGARGPNGCVPGGSSAEVRPHRGILQGHQGPNAARQADEHAIGGKAGDHGHDGGRHGPAIAPQSSHLQMQK